MTIEELAEHDLEALGDLYRQFRGEDPSLEKMRATFGRLSGNPNYIGQEIFPGSLNVDVGRPFDWHASDILPFRRRFSLLR